MGRARALVARRWFPLVLVAIVMAALQLLLTDPGREPSWDEAIYLSQVDGPAVWFGPQRSRGIVVLVAPLAGLGVPLAWIRATLALGSSAALVAAAAAWAPLVGARLAAAAAIVTAGSWLVLFYGSEVMPNLWSALALLGAAGLVARGLVRGDARPRWAAVALLLAAGLFRPIDAAVAGFVLIAVSAVRTRSIRWPGWLGTAVTAGCLPWLVEMSARFGGPLGALREAAEVGRVGEGGPLAGIRLHLALADGPAIGSDGGPVPWSAVLWWVAVLVLGVAGALRATGSARFAVRLALAVGGTLLVAYVGLVGGEAPRYLLPAIFLLVMAAVVGAATLPPKAIVACAVIGLAWVGWQVGVLRDVHAEAVAQRRGAHLVGEFVRSLAGEGPCVVFATSDYPQIGYASGCRALWLRDDSRMDVSVGTAGPGFLVTSSEHPARGELIPFARGGGYLIYRLGPASPTE
ncbi:MAG: hypothetical protein WD096_08725 [Actinomycetota bacterium]